MKDYLKLALAALQAEGKNPTLAELCDRAEYMRSRDVRTAKMNAVGVLRDFIELAEDARNRADSCGDDDEIYEYLAAMERKARQVIEACQK